MWMDRWVCQKKVQQPIFIVTVALISDEYVLSIGSASFNT